MGELRLAQQLMPSLQDLFMQNPLPPLPLLVLVREM